MFEWSNDLNELPFLWSQNKSIDLVNLKIVSVCVFMTEGTRRTVKSVATWNFGSCCDDTFAVNITTKLLRDISNDTIQWGNWIIFKPLPCKSIVWSQRRDWISKSNANRFPDWRHHQVIISVARSGSTGKILSVVSLEGDVTGSRPRGGHALNQFRRGFLSAWIWKQSENWIALARSIFRAWQRP
jgi:hypothetical protein